MIYEQRCVSANCDGCEADFESQFEGFNLFLDNGTLTEKMMDADWHVTGDIPQKCYCPDCHEINDNDEFVLKGKALQKSTYL
jgi:hypothetical protein